MHEKSRNTIIERKSVFVADDMESHKMEILLSPDESYEVFSRDSKPHTFYLQLWGVMWSGFF